MFFLSKEAIPRVKFVKSNGTGIIFHMKNAEISEVNDVTVPASESGNGSLPAPLSADAILKSMYRKLKKMK